MKPKCLSRREFIAGTTLTLAGCAAGRPRVRYRSRNGKLNVAGIGVGGRGGAIIGACENENVVALCDVDDERGSGSFERWPNARRYRDYRVMLDKQKDIEAVTIGTPDHSHAPAAFMAMQRGIHVYVEKPLTHTIREARILRKAARKYGVATQMGNQGHTGEGVRRVCETIWCGLLGDIDEVHCWTNRPVWPQNLTRPAETPPVPSNLDWDLWLGPAPVRPYNDIYHPFRWRGWWDFGCGALGDMGCHVMDPVFWALNLGDAETCTVEPVALEGGNEETGPAWSIIRYDFPKRGHMPPVTVYWYDGGKRPPRPEGLGPEENLGGGSGSLFIGTEGFLVAGEYGDNPRLLPEAKMRDFTWPDPIIPRSPGPNQEWTEACKGGRPAGSNFEYSAPFTEMVLLGNVAIRAGGKIEWNSPKTRITNDRELNELISKRYRKGWDWMPV